MSLIAPRSFSGAPRAAVLALLGMISLSGCGGSNESATDQSYSLSASVSGLTASGLSLSVNDSTLTVAAGTTTKMLAVALTSGTPYSVTVATQPAGQTCSVAGGSGVIQSSAVTNVAITCSAQTYSLGGSITGLTVSGLVLTDGTDVLSVSAGATGFTLPTKLASGSSYAVSVQTQPAGAACVVSHGTGTMPAAALNTVTITCTADLVSVGGTVTGLGVGGLVLVNNSADSTTVNASVTQFTMASDVAVGSHYAVTVSTQPTGLVCTVSNGSGTVGAGGVSDIGISCVSNFTLLHAFAGGSTDAASPAGTFIFGSDGNLYGTSGGGGSASFGTAYQLTPAGAVTVLHSFLKYGDGAYPQGSLLEDSSGDFFGMTWGGGLTHGVVFEVAAGGTTSTLHNFADDTTDGGYPDAGLTLGSDGNYYGTTGAGGSGSGTGSNGTVFKITPAGVETVLYVFAGGTTDGLQPQAALLLASDGNFYGTTSAGGASGNGTVFRITPSGTETLLYSFAGGTADGTTPRARLIQGTDGNFYGTTTAGGANGYGTVFKVTPGGVETVLYSFAGGTTDGATPAAGLLLGNDGNFYGTTSAGGSNNAGTVFRLSPGGSETLVYVFGGSSDGSNLQGGLVEDSNGVLYGTAASGGANGQGTAYTIQLQ